MNYATIIDVTYRWNDEPYLTCEGKVAVCNRELSIEEFDEVFDRPDIFYILEPSEKVIGDHGEFTILSSEVVR